MKKSLFFILTAVLFISACKEFEEMTPIFSYDVLSAQIEQDEKTKTVLDEENNVLWSQGDQIIAFAKTSLGFQYQLKDNYAGMTYGSFSKISTESGDDLDTGMGWDHIVAYYPYSESIECKKSNNGYSLDVVLPAEQNYAPKSFANGAFPMVAVSEDNNITFNNVCGGIKLLLKGTQNIVSITIAGKDNEKLSGDATITAYTDGTKPVIDMTSTDESAKSVTLNCGDGVRLNEITATEFIIALPPVPFGKGFIITIKDDGSKTYTLETNTANNVLRSSLLNMPTVTLGDELIYEENEDSGEVKNIGQVGPLSFYLKLTASTATFTGKLTDVGASADIQKISIILHSTNQVFEINKNDVFHTIPNLSYNTNYSYSLYVKYNGVERSSEVKQFTTVNVVPDVVDPSVTATTATFSGTVKGLSNVDKEEIQVGFAYSSVENGFQNDQNNTRIPAGEISDDAYSISLNSLQFNTNYYYCSYVMQNNVYNYGEVKQFNTANVVPNVVEPSVTATTATFSVTAEGLSDVDKDKIQVGMAYSSEENGFQNDQDNAKIEAVEISNGEYSISLNSLQFNKNYYYRSYVKQNDVYTYGDVVEHFTTVNVVPDVSVVDESVTATSATFSGTVTGLSDVDKDEIQVGFAYSSEISKLKSEESIKKPFSNDPTSMSITIDDYQTQIYYYCSYILQDEEYTYGTEEKAHTIRGASLDLSEATAIDLSSSESANCYIVSEPGTYKFQTVKGNSPTSVGNVASCTILWESFGTDMTPAHCSIIDGVYYNEGMIAFKTVDTFTNGNAVIAAKDDSGNILWSWHIWLTESPAEHIYKNSAGTMMDRNLGATSATPGDVGALGLLYQWGRKDPFLGSSSISENTVAASTITWPEAVESTTIDYVTANPTTFVKGSSTDYDWYNTTDDSYPWSATKTIYDPCPPGWRVPTETWNSQGVWTKASGYRVTDYVDKLYIEAPHDFDNDNYGMNFSSTFGTASTIWYPAPGYRSSSTGELTDVGNYGHYWSSNATTGLDQIENRYEIWEKYAYIGSHTLSIYNYQAYWPNAGQFRATGNAVRCFKVTD